jgi:glucose-1-phosphate adenylyltransferase
VVVSQVVVQMDNVSVIIMAGGTGERLQPLTRVRSKPAVPFGGKFRLIDFTLSNCINSGIRQISVLIQYRSTSLQRHIQEGWGISSSGLGDYIYCVPAQQKIGKDWYRGTADAIRQNLDLVRNKGAEHVFILSGDQIYKMNYLQMLAYHKAQNADLTISAIRIRREQAAGSLGILEVDEGLKLFGFEEKPAQPKTIPNASDFALASMGIYVFKTDVLLKALQGEGDDFGKEIIPRMIDKGSNIFVYDFTEKNKIEDFIAEVVEGKRRKVLVDRTRDSSYWRDVGSVDSYYEASMDLVSVDPIFNLYGEKWVIRTFQRPLPPSKCVIGGTMQDSMVCDGCIISGAAVQRSILSPGVVVEKNALVEESIIFDDVIIEPDVKVRRAIIDKEARIQKGASIGYDAEADKSRGCIISDNGIAVVPRGMEIG